MGHWLASAGITPGPAARRFANPFKYWQIRVESPNATPSSVIKVGMLATGLASARPGVKGTVA